MTKVTAATGRGTMCWVRRATGMFIYLYTVTYYT